jgi:hypothetical protein
MAEEVRFVVDYYVNGEYLEQDEHAPWVPTVGSGVHLHRQAYRVKDVWLNYEDQAPVNYGIAVFLEVSELGSGFYEVGGEYYRG